MNKLIAIIAGCMLLLGAMSSCGRTDEERSHILKVYNWGDYIDEEVLAEFPAWYKEQTRKLALENDAAERAAGRGPAYAQE